MTEVAREMADEGELSREAVDGYVFPVYARTADEARAPVDPGGALHDAFEALEALDRPGGQPVPRAVAGRRGRRALRPRLRRLRQGLHGVVAAAGLFGRGGGPAGEADALLDEYFRRLERRFADAPERDAFRDWTLTVVLARR